MGREFEVRKEIELDATPEQVWQAIATGPGIDSWFMGRSEIEPGEGGSTRLTVGGHTEEATVTAWEPLKQFAYRTGEGDDGSFMAIEWLIEGRDQASTVLRLVQNGFLSGDWETEYEAMKSGWDLYLHTLGAYLAHFPGRTGKSVSTMRLQAAGQERAWEAIKDALGLAGTVTEGDRVSFTPDGLAPIDGVVDYANLPSFLGVRTGDGLYRFVHSGPLRGDAVFLAHHLFSDGVDEEKAEQAWQGWLTGLFG
ncbi:SRPBCC domain-containing protein [Streptosporangium sp. NPDC051023]|uniref:SRPBCC family protein n=1 Tax=Streptosporangium sp. NPDC051023 TaxID=3155410 RepID=UPI00344DE30A